MEHEEHRGQILYLAQLRLLAVAVAVQMEALHQIKGQVLQAGLEGEGVQAAQGLAVPEHLVKEIMVGLVAMAETAAAAAAQAR